MFLTQVVDSLTDLAVAIGVAILSLLGILGALAFFVFVQGLLMLIPAAVLYGVAYMVSYEVSFLTIWAVCMVVSIIGNLAFKRETSH